MAITINEMSRQFDEIEKYLMTVSPAIISMKDVEDGTSIKVAGTLTFTDVKEQTGEEVEILSIITDENEVYSCQSATFKRSLGDIVNIMGDKEFSIIKTSGTTKAGRPYIDCQLDLKSIAKKKK